MGPVGSVGVGAIVGLLGVGVPRNGVGVEAAVGVVAVAAVVGKGVGIGVAGIEVDPAADVGVGGVLEGVLVKIGLGAPVPIGAGVPIVPTLTGVGVGLARPLKGSVGEESHPAINTTDRNPAKRRTRTDIGKSLARTAPARSCNFDPRAASLVRDDSRVFSADPSRRWANPRCIFREMSWCARGDSNAWPSDPESDALSS